MNKKINNLTLGADPEFFLYNITKGKIIPAVGLIGGNKENGLFISTGESFLEDNVMVEFTTSICKNSKELNDSIKIALTYLRNNLPEYYDFVFKASHVFESCDLESEQAKEFGCEPDYNVYTLRMNESPAGKNLLTRTCSGHIHIGYDNSSIDTSLDLIKIMDLFLGVPSILLDNDRIRRKMYGKAGCFRLKSYGFEYRVLSNFWVNNSILVNWVVNNINKAITYYEINGSNLQDDKNIIKCINKYDSDLAVELINKYSIDMPDSYSIDNFITKKNNTLKVLQ